MERRGTKSPCSLSDSRQNKRPKARMASIDVNRVSDSTGPDCQLDDYSGDDINRVPDSTGPDCQLDDSSGDDINRVSDSTGPDCQLDDSSGDDINRVSDSTGPDCQLDDSSCDDASSLCGVESLCSYNSHLSLDFELDLYPRQEPAVRKIRYFMCRLFVESFEKKSTFLVSSTYKISESLGMVDVDTEGSDDGDLLMPSRGDVFVVCGPDIPTDFCFTRSIKLKRRRRDRSGMNKKRLLRKRRMMQTFKKQMLSGKGRRLPRKTRRKVCRYKQCLFCDNGCQSSGGKIGSCRCVICCRLRLFLEVAAQTLETTRRHQRRDQVAKENDRLATEKTENFTPVKKTNPRMAVCSISVTAPRKLSAKATNSVDRRKCRRRRSVVDRGVDAIDMRSTSTASTQCLISHPNISGKTDTPTANTCSDSRKSGPTSQDDEDNDEINEDRDRLWKITEVQNGPRTGSAFASDEEDCSFAADADSDVSGCSSSSGQDSRSVTQASTDLTAASVVHHEKRPADAKDDFMNEFTTVSVSGDSLPSDFSVDNTDNNSRNLSGFVGCASHTVSDPSQRDSEEGLNAAGTPSECAEGNTNAVCNDACVKNDANIINSNATVSSTDDRVSVNASGQRSWLGEQYVGLDALQSPHEAEKSDGSKETRVYRHVPKISVKILHQELEKLEQTNPEVFREGFVTPHRSSAKKHTDEGESDGNDRDEIRVFYSSPQVAPGARQHVVAMMRVQQGQRQQPQQVVVVHSGLENEWSRLATFSRYNPPADIYVIPIANAGFFLPSEAQSRHNSEVKVECAFCGVLVLITKFRRGRKAMDVHRQVSPRCSFVLGESTGNVSIAEVAQTSGAEFLNKYSSPSGPGGAPATHRRLLAAAAPLSGLLQQDEVLATDSVQDCSAVEGPAALSFSLPTNKPGSHFSILPSVPDNSGGNGDRSGETTLPQQQEARGVTAPSSPAAGQTVADSRPASSAGQPVGQHTVQGTRSTPNADGTNGAAMPFQTATVSQPQTSAGSNLSTANQTATANQMAAVNQTAATNQTATVSAGGVNSEGTAREEPPSSAPASTGEGGQRGREKESSQNGQERQLVTYEELGIFSQRPKRPDMAVTQVRINTFEGWPHNESHPREEMAEAGFYYTGHVDLVRCFHCKGGLKTWERSDKPWVEHSRWFPKCPFVKLCKGQRFVDAVQKLNNPDTRPTITAQDVAQEMNRLEEEERRNLGPDVLLFSSLPNPAPPVDPALDALTRTDLRIDADVTEASMQEIAERLEDENEQMKSDTLCKVCQTSEVNVLFLPCGHLVACGQCAPALRTCAICRQTVKGSVRVQMDEKPDSGRMNEELTGQEGDTAHEVATP